MYTVTETTWSGVPAIRLADTEAETAALVVPSLGGNLISLTCKGEELLRTPPDARSLREQASRWGIPVLIPPNRIALGRFRFGGRDYQLETLDSAGGNHIHGFALRRPWQTVATATADGAAATIAFAAADHPDVLAQFPHPFVLSLTYTLKGQTLRCSPQIRNDGPDAMPFGLGFHPYLLAPQSGRPEIRMTPARLWDATDCMPSGRFLQPEGAFDLAGWQPAHAVHRDCGYALTAREPDGWSRFELADRVRGRLITLRAAPEYRHWVTFNGFAGSISPEPYTCMTDAFNLDLPHDVSGMTAVAGGESRPAGDWELTWS